MAAMKRIAPCLRFDDQAEEAVRCYASIFQDFQTGAIVRYPETGHEIHGRQPGSVMTVDYMLEGPPFTALNGGPVSTFNEAISLQVYGDTREENDCCWERLSEGGDAAAQQRAWLKDRFGASWQVVPTILLQMLNDPRSERSERVAEVVFAMEKPILEDLRRAHQG